MGSPAAEEIAPSTCGPAVSSRSVMRGSSKNSRTIQRPTNHSPDLGFGRGPMCRSRDRYPRQRAAIRAQRRTVRGVRRRVEAPRSRDQSRTPPRATPQRRNRRRAELTHGGSIRHQRARPFWNMPFSRSSLARLLRTGRAGPRRRPETATWPPRHGTMSLFTCGASEECEGKDTPRVPRRRESRRWEHSFGIGTRCRWR